MCRYYTLGANTQPKCNDLITKPVLCSSFSFSAIIFFKVYTAALMSTFSFRMRRFWISVTRSSTKLHMYSYLLTKRLRPNFVGNGKSLDSAMAIALATDLYQFGIFFGGMIFLFH